MRQETIVIDYLQFYLYFSQVDALLYYIIFIVKYLFILVNKYIYKSFKHWKMETRVIIGKIHSYVNI